MKTSLFCLSVWCCMISYFSGILAVNRVSAQQTPSASPFKLIFLGDSITQQGADAKGYVTLMREELKNRHPGQTIEVIGKGIGGNRVPDLLARLKTDVLDLSPNLVVIYIGINDVWHSTRGKGTPAAEFEQGLTSIVHQVSATGARVILCTPSVIGEKTDGSNALDAMLDEYSAIGRKVALATGATLLDLRSKFLHDLKIVNDHNAESGVFTTDGVHLNEAGNQFVKDGLLHCVESVLFAQTLKHVVLVKFKPEARQSDINLVTDAFNGLQQEIDTVVSLESGTDISPEGLNQGHTHAFILSFANAKDRDAYLVHPAHEKFVGLIGPHVAGVTVVDFWAR